MVRQVMEQPVLQGAPQTGKAQKQDKANGAGFDELLQQKQQAGGDSPRTQDSRPVQKKDDAPRTEAKEESEPQAEANEEIPDDAKAVLAALMLQPQPEIVEAAAEAPVETAAEAVVEITEEAPVQELAADGQEQPVQQEAQAPVQRQQIAETEAQPQRELQQAEVVTEAPETAEAQPRQAETREQQTGVETVETRQAPEKAEEDEHTAEAPLFQPEAVEDAAPIKVADPAPVLNPRNPLPIESAEAPRELADTALIGVENGSEVSVIRITPENLGPVQMTLSREADGALHVALEAANPKTTALLEKHANNVQNIMAGNLREEVRVEVRENDRPQQQDLAEGQDRQQQRQQERQRRQREDGDQEFLQRLRLGLAGTENRK